MRTRVIVFIALLCMALPLYAGDDQSDNSSSEVTLTLDIDNPEVVSSFSWGISAPQRVEGGAVFKELTLTKTLSKSSPKLFHFCATGEHIKKAIIIAKKANGKLEYLKITMTDAVITSYQVGGSGTPTETISLSYATVDYILIGL